MNGTKAAPEIIEHVSLASFTTLGIGGPARFMLRARTEEQILDALEFARARCCPVFILGGGSNILVSDSGFPGLVIKIELPGIDALDAEPSSRISAAAGVEWDAFVQYCVARGLAGIECLSGIPGTVGGAPVQNIGAHGEDVQGVITQVRALDRDALKLVDVSTVDCRFAYRSSIFNTTHKDRYVIVRVDFALRTDGKPRLLYADLQQRFTHSAQPPKLSEVREAVLEIRKAKSMVLSENDPDCRSAGSFFKNPILDQNSVSVLEAEARAGGLLNAFESVPRFAAGPGKEKLSAAWLIEHAGFHKGYTHQNAGISNKHALALVNRGGSTARDILELMRMIQDRVQQAFGVELQPEPVFVGFGEDRSQESEVRSQNSQ
jgi:UDP-N-acetylmuramate dehydrogenase